jgi:hypothetical protein
MSDRIVSAVTVNDWWAFLASMLLLLGVAFWGGVSWERYGKPALREWRGRRSCSTCHGHAMLPYCPTCGKKYAEYFK